MFVVFLQIFITKNVYWYQTRARFSAPTVRASRGGGWGSVDGGGGFRPEPQLTCRMIDVHGSAAKRQYWRRERPCQHNGAIVLFMSLRVFGRHSRRRWTDFGDAAPVMVKCRALSSSDGSPYIVDYCRSFCCACKYYHDCVTGRSVRRRWRRQRRIVDDR